MNRSSSQAPDVAGHQAATVRRSTLVPVALVVAVGAPCVWVWKEAGADGRTTLT